MNNANSLWSALGSAVVLRLIMAVVNFGQFWFFSQLLSAHELGGYALLLGVLMMLHALPLLGLSIPLIRRLATDPGKASAEVSNAFALSFPMALLIGLGVYLYGQAQLDAELHAAMACLALTMLPVAWILVAECALLGMERMDLITKVQALEALGRLIFGVLVIQLGYGLLGVFVCILVLRCVVALYYKLSAIVPAFRWPLINADMQRRNFRELPTFIGIVILAALIMRLNILILEQTRDLAEVALLAASARLYDAALMLPIMAAQTLMPTLARMLHEDTGRFGQMFREVLSQIMLLGSFVSIGLAALASTAVEVVYPQHLHAAGIVFFWMALGTALAMVEQILSSAMLAAKDQAADMRSLVVFAVVLTPALLLLTGPWGALGAAWASLIALLAGLGTRILWAARQFAFPELPGLALRHGACLVVGAVGMLFVHRVQPVAAPLWALLAGLTGWYLSVRLSGLLSADWWQRLRQWHADMRTAR